MACRQCWTRQYPLRVCDLRPFDHTRPITGPVQLWGEAEVLGDQIRTGLLRHRHCIAYDCGESENSKDARHVGLSVALSL